MYAFSRIPLAPPKKWSGSEFKHISAQCMTMPHSLKPKREVHAQPKSGRGAQVFDNFHFQILTKIFTDNS